MVRQKRKRYLKRKGSDAIASLPLIEISIKFIVSPSIQLSQKTALMVGDGIGQQIELGLLGESEFAAVFGNFIAGAIFVH